MCSSQVGPDLTHNYYSELERLTRDKHLGLFGLFINDEEKSFMTLTQGVDVINLFFFVTDAEQK